jgi:hypothetical protein
MAWVSYFITERTKVYDEQHLTPPNVLFPFGFLISSLSPRSVCSCIRSSVEKKLARTMDTSCPQSHTVIVLILRCLSLNDILPQKLCNFLGVCDLLRQLLASGCKVAIRLKVLSGFCACGEESIHVACHAVSFLVRLESTGMRTLKGNAR